MIRVRYFATLRDITGKREEFFEDVPTIRMLLTLLYKKYGDAFRREIESRNMILVNGKNILDMNGYETEISDGDEISIFPPVGGG